MSARIILAGCPLDVVFSWNKVLVHEAETTTYLVLTVDI